MADDLTDAAHAKALAEQAAASAVRATTKSIEQRTLECLERIEGTLQTLLNLGLAELPLNVLKPTNLQKPKGRK